MNNRINYKRNVDCLIVFILVAWTRFYTAFRAMPVYTVSDEVSSISIAALLAGYDWTDVISHAGYYGIGYLWIFAPLYMLKLPAVLIYKITVAFSGVILGLGAIVCYRILENFFTEISRSERILIAAACGSLSYVSTYQNSIRNEEMLILVCWMISYSFFSVLKEINVKKNQVSIVILCLYSLTLHARSMAMIVGIILSTLIIHFIFKKDLLGQAEIIILIAGTLLVNGVLKIYQNYIWDGQAKNSSVTEVISRGAAKFKFDWAYIKAQIGMVFGNLYTAYAVSAGIFVVALVGIILLFVRHLKKKDLTIEETSILCLSIFLIITNVIIFGGLMFSWGGSIANAIRNGTEAAYSYKGFTYMRYPGYLWPPLFMCGLLILKKDRKNAEHIALISTGILIVLTVGWCVFVLPYQAPLKSLLFIVTTYVNGAGIMWWTLQILVILGNAILWPVITKNRRYLLILTVLLFLFSTAQRLVAYEKNEKLVNEKNYYHSYLCAEFVNEIKSDFDGTLTVYAYDTTDVTDHQNWYMYQLLCYDVHIVPELPTDDQDEVVLLTNGELDETERKGLKEIQLDAYNYVYYSGDQTEIVINTYINKEAND